MTPVKSPANSTLGKTGKSARSSTGSHAVSVPENSNESTPISRMTVQGEKVEAADLWLEHHDELENKFKELSPRQFREFVAERSAQLITDKIAEVLLYQRAKLRMPDGMDKKIEEYADGEIRKTVTADYGGIQRRYEKKLEKEGRSLDAVREQLRRQIVISSFLDNEVRPRVADPTRAELYEAFHSNIDAWRKPARRSMSLIDARISEFLPKDAAAPTREQSEAARAEARQRIEAARSELGTGASFADVARKYSQGLHAEEGGAWGYVNGDSVRERFAPAVEALAKLDAGRVSDIIETPDGFFLVRCDVLQPGVEPDFQSIQPQLREEFFRNQYNRQIAELVFELRKNARVEPENLERFHSAAIAGAFNIVEPLPTAGR
jgi:peptidyl-prolyl cis-trans isomerase SurA